MSEDTFLTLREPSTAIYKEKGSKFLSFAIPIDSEEKVKEALEGLKKAYYDARHHCYAYMLGKDQLVFRANDAGEPNHSAGDPILGQIRSYQLTNLLVVVVRYFGGTKLGVGGLISAYKTAAAMAIGNGIIEEQILKKEITLHFAYIAMNDVMQLVKEYDLELVAQDFQLSCSVTLLVRRSLENIIVSKLAEIASVDIAEN